MGLEKSLFSRNGDDISGAFPDVLDRFSLPGVFDGELLAFKDGEISSFNDLQQRLNKKKPSKKLQAQYPCGLILYDILTLSENSTDEQNGSQVNHPVLTHLPLHNRQQILTETLAQSELANEALIQQSEVFSVADAADLNALRESICRGPNGYIEGLMLKRKDSLYTAGRPKGIWYKYKRDAQLVDAVIMYAQRGSGKAYSGFTDKELKALDKWVRQNTTGRFGPVKEVAKALVFEVAFDAAHSSKRHKSGVALRFPRIHRIRWDKPAAEADQLIEFKQLPAIP